MEYKNKDFKIVGYPINKFKTINIRVVFLCNATKRDFILGEFLAWMLTYSNNKYKTNREYTLRLQDLYDLYLSSYISRRGNKLITVFEYNMIDSKYTSKKVLKDSINMLKESIFNPNIIDNHFDINSFNAVKSQMISFIENLNDNSQALVNEKVVSMYTDSPISITYTESKKYLEEIDEYSLYEYYKEFIKNREIAVYICGNYNDDIIDLIKKFPLKSKVINYQNNIIINKKMEPTYLYKDFSQAKLALLLNYDNITEFEYRYVSTIMNSILGGLQDSLLMESIREEDSLVYYIDSMIYKMDQVIIVYSGFSKLNIDLILKRIDECINKLIKGDYPDSKLDAAILDTLVVLEDYERNPFLILDYMISYNHFFHATIKERISNYKKVTKEDISKLAKKIKKMNMVLLRDKNERV